MGELEGREARHGDSRPRAITGKWPFAGRDTELSLILEDLERGRGVVVAGPAGVGKSRLAREAVARIEAEDLVVHQVVATRAAAAVPLGAFGHLLDPAELTAATPGVEPLTIARASMLRSSAGKHVVVLVDDLHLLDDVSAALVHSVAMTGEATLLGTLRSGTDHADAITALWKDDICSRLELMPLGRDDTGDLLRAVFEGEVDGPTRRELERRSRGNLLFLRELVRAGVTAGNLARRGGLWTWSGAVDSPTLLVELVADGLDSRTRSEMELLHLVSLGEPLAWDLITGLGDEGDAETLVEEGFLDIEDLEGSGPAVRLHHPLLGEVLRRTLPDTRRRKMLRALAGRARDVSTGGGADILRIATWLLDAGEPLDATEAVAAARTCMLLDTSLTERLARAGLVTGGGTDARVVLAQHLMFTHRAEEAEAVLAEPSAGQALALGLMRANNLTFGLGRPEEAVALLEQLALDAPDPETLRTIESHLLPSLLFTGHVTEVVKRHEMLDAPDLPDAVRLRSAITAIPALASQGRPLAALDVAADALVLTGAAADELPFALGQIGAGMILAHQWAGDLEAADAIARIGYEASVDRGSTLLRGVAALRLGQADMLRGSMLSAQARVREAVLALREADAGFLASALDHLELLCALAGAHIQDDTEPADEGVARYPLYRPDSLRLRAGIDIAEGRLGPATESLVESMREALRLGQGTQAVFAAFDLALLGDARSADVLRSRSELEGSLLHAMLDAIHGIVEHAPDSLDRSADVFEGLGCMIFAAKCAAAAVRLHLDDGLRARAAAASGRAAALAARCDGIEIALPDTTAQIPQLTPREREVAALAARGETDVEIADELGVSVRTVQTHLHHAYTKLGVTSRRDLPHPFPV